MSALPIDTGAARHVHHVHRHTTHEHEHEFEACPGLPERLPAGERVLWQGAPSWTLLARECFHVVKIGVYFAVLIAACIAHGITAGEGVASIATTAAGAIAMSLTTIGLVLLLARMSARTTLYTITDRRVVMRIGIVLSLTLNLPFARITAAGIHRSRADRGDIALTLDDATRIAYLHLWPHARPWRIARTQPSLRAIDEVDAVARLLTDAWQRERAESTAVPRAAVVALDAGRLAAASARRPVVASTPSSMPHALDVAA